MKNKFKALLFGRNGENALSSVIKNFVMTAVFALLMIAVFISLLFRNEKDVSEAERRPLAQAPDLSYKAVADGTYFEDFEEYALDQFIFRDVFRSIKAIGAYGILGRLDNNDLYYYKGRIYKIEKANHESWALGAEKIESLASRYDGMKLYYSVIPDRNSVISSESGRPCIDIDALCSVLDKTITSAEYLDICNSITADMYYRTDLHWDQSKILSVADLMLEKMGSDYRVSEDSFVKNELDGFKGSYYDQMALPLKSETVAYLTNSMLSDLIITDLATGNTIPLYDANALETIDPYNLFVGGTQPLIRIQNPNASTDKKLYLFRDSFGSSIAPLLIGGYSEIVLIDIRYVSSDHLHLFVDFEDGNDMLFLYSTHVLNESAILR